jgi:hypothetical protein
MSASTLFQLRLGADPATCRGFASLALKVAADQLTAATDSGDGLNADQAWAVLAFVELAQLAGEAAGGER